MEITSFEDEHFEKMDFSENPPQKGDYDNCTFVNCNFGGADLSGFSFTECQFAGCNLGMAKLMKTALKDVQFRDCKLLGLHFEHCNDFLFEVTFDNCVLNLASFYQVKLKKTRFTKCSLQEVDFSEADLTGAVLDDCDLAGATFVQTVLEKADFRTAVNYALDPESNRIKKAKFSLPGVIGLLAKYDIDIT